MLRVTSGKLYFWVFLVFICNLAILASTAATLDLAGLPAKIFWSLQLGLLFYACARHAARAPHSLFWRKASAVFEALFFLQLAWMNLRLFNHLTMMAPFPLQDDLLAGWDRSLGFDWLGYFGFVHDRPWLIELLDVSYTSLSPLSAAALLGLILMGHLERARFFAETFFLTALACMVLGLTMPAVAAVAHFLPDPSAYGNFRSVPGVYHLGYMEALRSQADSIALHIDRLPGLVTFPSFHTAAGILLCTAYFRTALFLPVVAYAVVMIASTPVFGGHYLVDLIAGTIIAAGISYWFSDLRRSRAGSVPQPLRPAALSLRIGRMRAKLFPRPVAMKPKAAPQPR